MVLVTAAPLPPLWNRSPVAKILVSFLTEVVHTCRVSQKIDAEYWYNLVRFYKPKKIIEIGSGNSTKMARLALSRNVQEGFACEHICIEPFEMPWLEQLGIDIVRKRVEEIPVSFFSTVTSRGYSFY